MPTQVQTGNMLDVVIEGKSIGLKQRDSDHRKYHVIWLPEPEGLRDVLTAEINRLRPPTTPAAGEVLVSREDAAKVADSVAEQSTRTSEEAWNEGDHDTAKIYMGWSNGAQAVAAAIRTLPAHKEK